jgi:hypothetical protein
MEMEMDLGKYKGNKVILLDKFDWNIVENGYGSGDGSGVGSE